MSQNGTGGGVDGSGENRREHRAHATNSQTSISLLAEDTVDISMSGWDGWGCENEVLRG